MTTLKEETKDGRRVATVFGQPFSPFCQDRALARCDEFIRGHISRHVVTANMDFLAQADDSPSIRKMLFEADEVLCDGMPLVWASRMKGNSRLPERVAGSDLVPRLLDHCEKNAYRVFFFGSDPKTLDKLQAKLAKSHPSLLIAGAVSPPVGDMEEWDNESYIQEIQKSKAALLLVALGFPKQDRWIQKFARSTGAKLSIGIGASLDFIAGKQTRSPRWMQKSGLEWLWRLGTDPMRLFGRYFRDGMVLGKLLVKQTLWNLISHGPIQPRRDWSQRAVLSGIPQREFHITAFETGGAISERPCQAETPKGWICDCSRIDHISISIIDQLNQAARQAANEELAFAVFNPPPILRWWLKLFDRNELFPIYECPIALSSAMGSELRVHYPHPSHARRWESFCHSMLELLHAAETQKIVLDLAHLSSGFCTATAEKIKKLQSKATQFKKRLSLRNDSKNCEDWMHIFGING